MKDGIGEGEVERCERGDVMEDIPKAAMCSEVRTGRKPTKGICIEASVPRA